MDSEVNAITGAGQTTVTQTLRFTAYSLYSDSKFLLCLLTGLRDLFSSLVSEAIGELTLAQLGCPPYLMAVILKGLRLNAGLATSLARIALDRELSMTTWLMHWDEGVYPNARRFEPERCMYKEGDGRWRRHLHHFQGDEDLLGHAVN